MQITIASGKVLAALTVAATGVALAAPLAAPADASAAAFGLKPNEKRFSYDRTSVSFDLSARGVKNVSAWMEENPGTVDFIGEMSGIVCEPIPGFLMKAACSASMAAAAPVLKDRLGAAAKSRKCFGIAGGTRRESWRAGSFGPVGSAGCKKTW